MALLIIGGTGSLGNVLVDRFISKQPIYIYSRDENKQWVMRNKYAKWGDKLQFIIGDIADRDRLCYALVKSNPVNIIIAAALKHIDICELNVSQSIKTNITGIENVIHCITIIDLPILVTTLFVSTDKACSPGSIYGMCKAISERIVIEKSNDVQPGSTQKFVVVRYGNVLNSRGSLLPKFHDIGRSDSKEFTVTHKNMTRFFMRLEESVSLIEYALAGISGCTYIPDIGSYRITDIAEVFGQLYNKPVVFTGLRPGEKMHETLINEMEFRRTTRADGVFIIHPPLNCERDSEFNNTYNSADALVDHPDETIKQFVTETA
jgi:UDP-N-acetylglucosamine 4,6-dehydratase